MLHITFNQLVPILQLSVSPMILISGMGLLILTLTNRFGRMVDRARILNQELRNRPDAAHAEETRTQIRILMRRAGILRLSITLGAITAFIAGLLVLLLFAGALLQLELGGLIAAAFCIAVLALIGCITTFIIDMNLALQAVRLEVKV